MSEIYVSIIIPAYNESERIATTLEEILNFLRKQSYASEILIADDGSKDETCHIADSILANFPHEILRSEENRGKGHAVRRGMLRARGEYLFFMDADLSTPIEEMTPFLKYLQNNYDIVIGSRAMKDSHIVVHQNVLRERMGKVFNFLARRLTFKDIYDSQCGFKSFRRNVARDLFGSAKLNGFGFDAEILYLAQRKSYRILEAPITWRNSPKSRVSILGDPVKMFWDLIRIRWIHRNSR